MFANCIRLGTPVCICITVVLGFLAHSFFSCGFTGVSDDVLEEHFDALDFDLSFWGWD